VLVDVHVHVYPAHIAPRIIQHMETMGVEFGNTTDSAGYLQLMRDGLIDFALLNEHVDAQRLVERANNYVAELLGEIPGRLFGMAILARPDDSSPAELTRCVRELKFVGLKFQGAVVQTPPSDLHCMRVWEKALELGIPVLAHGGPHQEEMYRHTPPNSLYENEPAAPAEWLTVVREFPQLRLVLAHLGGAAWYRNDVLKLLQENPNVMLDNSLWYLGMSAEEFVSFVGEVGPDRIMFGSDYPGGNTRKDIELFWKLPLDDEAREMIAWRNAASFFDLPLIKEKV